MRGMRGMSEITNAQSPMPNPQCPIPNAQSPMPNPQCPIPHSILHSHWQTNAESRANSRLTFDNNLTTHHLAKVAANC